MSVLSILVAVFAFANLTFAQSHSNVKRQLSDRALPSAGALGMAAPARVTARSASKPPSTTDNWTGTAGDNNWGTAGNWSAGVPNGSNFLVTIGTTTAAVNLNINAAVGSLTLSNSGDALNVLNNETLTADGNITNNGSITLNSGGNFTELIIGTSNVTLSGTGTLTMGNNLNNLIVGSAAANKLTNSETIQGSGNIGAGQMALANSGTINATQSNALTIQTSNGTTNTGTLEATTGTLILNGNTFTNTVGTIKSTGSDVQLTNGVTVVGGTLTTTGTGLIHTVGAQSSTLNGLTNSGNYQVDNNAVTNLVGTITNSKNINMASVGNLTDLVINGSVSLAGTGTLTMSNNTNNYIFGTAASNVLTVGSGQTISGSGFIGFDPNINAGQMALKNNGIIDATQSNNLVIRTSNGTSNTGTLEATTGTLVLFGDTITQTGSGNISATGSDVQLQSGVTINGGTLKTSGTGLIHTTNGQTSTLENLTNSGNYQVDNNATTILLGTITNNGNMNLASGGNFTEFQLSGNVTLSGSGTLTMSNNPNNIILGATQTGVEVLTNNIAISGAGNIGDGLMVLNNTSLGTINANATNALVIAPSSGGVTNTGLLEATGGGTLQLNSGTYTNAVGTTQGTILAKGGTVNLENAATIVGGKLKTQNSGLIQDVATTGATLDGSTTTGAVTIVAGSSLSVVNNTVLNVKGSIVNNGTISLNSSGNFTELVVTGTSATLSGTGTLTMSNDPNNIIFGAAATDTLTNQETIQGSGNIGNGQMVFLNSGTVNANQSNALVIQTAGGTTNTGTLEATAGGTLLLNGASGGNITNTGGTIQANGATGAGNTAAVNLENGINITGGTITSNSFGSFNVLNSATLTSLTNTGTVNIGNNTALTLAGTIVNNGAINSNSGGNVTELLLIGNVALNGTGTVTMSNNTNNFIFGGVAADTLTVASTQTIQGAGHVGDSQMVLVNNGTIDANVSNALIIDANGGTTNTKTLEATAGGTLTLTNYAVTNTGAGTIMAGSGSTVNLQSGVTVSGGSLTGSGTFSELNTATLSGLTNSSTVLVNNNTVLTLAGTIVNNGSIQENSGSNVTEIVLSGNVTLSGTGTLTMSNNPNNFIFGGVGADVLTNASTIQGAGQIGDGQMSLVNSGTINANVSNGLTINVSGTVNNMGTFEATGSGGLVVTGPANSFLNYSSGTNTLTGGTYIAHGGNVTLPLGSSGGIATLAAKVTEEGGSQILNSNNGNANALNGLTSITSAGALTIGGVAFTDAGSFSNAGSLAILSGESFTVGSLTQISGGSLTAGTYVLDANLDLSGAAQNITTNAANLTLGGGTIHNNAGGTNALAGLATNTGKLTMANNATFTTAGNFSNTGTLTINGGSAFTVTGTLAQISGSTLSGGTFVLGGNLNVGSGINITTNSSTLTLQGGTIMSGATNALAGLNKNTKTLTLAGNANFTTAGNFTNSGKLTVNSGSTFGVTGTLTNLSAATLTGGTYIVGGTVKLAGANGGITTNAANLTLTGTSAKIMDGTSNALAGFNNNTGTFMLASGATLTTAPSNFTNSGTMVVSKGTTLTVGGTNNSYNQSAGTTTVDGTLTDAGTGAINVTGGKIQGAGTLKANVSIGGGGTTPTINIGDAGKAGLLKITGTYTQLSTGTMNASIGGTTVGTQYSQLQVTGAASLGGTLTAGLVNAFTPSVGQTFTVLKAASITGTFSNSTIAINGSEHFVVSYTSTGVVLTVASGPVSRSGTTAAVSQMAMASTKPVLGISPHLVLGNGLRHRIRGGGKPVWVAGLQRPGGHSNAIVARTTGLYSPRGGERMTMIARWNHPSWQSVADPPRSVTKALVHEGSPGHNNWVGPNRGINPRPTLVGLLATSTNRRVMPIRILRPSPPRMR